MPTLFDKTVQDEMFIRVDKLSATSQRKWGKMSVSQMLKHMSNAFSVPVSNLQLPKEPLYYIAANPFGRWLMIRAMTKWPKNYIRHSYRSKLKSIMNLRQKTWKPTIFF